MHFSILQHPCGAYVILDQQHRALAAQRQLALVRFRSGHRTRADSRSDARQARPRNCQSVANHFNDVWHSPDQQGQRARTIGRSAAPAAAAIAWKASPARLARAHGCQSADYHLNGVWHPPEQETSPRTNDRTVNSTNSNIIRTTSTPRSYGARSRPPIGQLAGQWCLAHPGPTTSRARTIGRSASTAAAAIARGAWQARLARARACQSAKRTFGARTSTSIGPDGQQHRLVHGELEAGPERQQHSLGRDGRHGRRRTIPRSAQPKTDCTYRRYACSSPSAVE